jgi:hypothetical protein
MPAHTPVPEPQIEPATVTHHAPESHHNEDELDVPAFLRKRHDF